MRGTISSCGFASGDRFVVGRWDRSPVGRTIDIMWARPDGHRVLLAPDERTAAFVTAVYAFDEVRVVPFVEHGGRRPDGVDVTAGPLRLELRAGAPLLWIPPRPLWFTRRIEAPIAAALMRVHTWGVSPTGVQEWYQARTMRLVRHASASVDGRDLGARRPLDPACGFGFSESPRWPSVVAVRPSLEWPGPMPSW